MPWKRQEWIQGAEGRYQSGVCARWRTIGSGIVKAYKGFDKDLKCKDHQYEIGKTYEEPKADLCHSGFHACEAPLNVFGYYAPAQSRYCEVALEDVSDERGDDTKIVSKKITVGAEIGIPGLVKAHVEYVKSHCTMEHTDPKQATAGHGGAATAGHMGAATAGHMGAATAGAQGRSHFKRFYLGGKERMRISARERRKGQRRDWRSTLLL